MAKKNCPNCNVELVEVAGALPEKCANCGLNFSQYGSFKELMDAYIEDKKRTQKPEEKGKKKNSFFDVLGEI